MHTLVTLAVGFAGGALAAYLYAAKAIAELKQAAAGVGVGFAKIEGKLTAVKKAL